MVTRSEFIKQLDDISELLSRFCDKAVCDVRAAGLAIKGDSGALEGVLSGQQAEESLRGGIERKCLDVMLLQQPIVGHDLRFVSGSFRIVSDLGRIDSMSRDIAYLIQELPPKALSKLSGNAAEMTDVAAEMIECSVKAFLETDTEQAEHVIASDKRINELYNDSEKRLVDLIRNGKSSAQYLPELLMIAKYFERIGDHAKRIADWAIFRKTGEHLSNAGKVTDILFDQND